MSHPFPPPARLRGLLLLLALAAGGCAEPFTGLGDRLVSLPWGVQMPRPEGTRLVHDKGAVFLYPAEEGWTLTLSVRRKRSGPAYGELGPAAAGALAGEARRVGAARPHVEFAGARVRPLGLTRAVWVRFRGPPGRGQEAVPFRGDERLFQVVALLEKNRRLYRLHLRAREGARAAALAAWDEVTSTVRFSGRPNIGFPGSDDLPEGTLGGMLREALGAAQ